MKNRETQMKRKKSEEEEGEKNVKKIFSNIF